VTAAVQATAQGRKTLPDGSPLQTPTVLQLAWLCDRWGIGLMGPEPDFRMVVQMDRALGIYRAFKKDIKDRQPEDWTIIKDVLKVVEGWE
jgi:hypothetical protein